MISEKTKAKIGFFLNGLGVLLGALGLFFVVYRLHAYKSEIDVARIGIAGYASILSLAVVYGAGNMFLALGWGRLLNFVGTHPRFSWVVWAYATSQLAKYVPGNVFQFFGRQALGVSAGIPNRQLAKSTILELAIVGGMGALFSPLVLPLVKPELSPLLTLALFMVVIVIALYLIRHIWNSHLRAVGIFYCLYLALSGFVFVTGFYIAGGSLEVVQIPTIAGAYVLAWLAGLVTPGAPAGIGVREAVLLFLLGGLSPGPVILLAVVIGRMITVLGDLLFFAGGLIAGRPNCPPDGTIF
ncbi:hypothetical protein [Mesorhizobium sp. NZP2298]|uniref:hypothetical protein n=1 Tax=Mesorhizobium sp. NZP2298 TaxID=2483403 RepID=UPI0015531CA2|nr:hypothetical protein [Mesorhizobium sp. NZP2298]QKC97779.1 hypothetical protein EB231_26270 [Mesorhizobium sp. NZP2298]